MGNVYIEGLSYELPHPFRVETERLREKFGREAYVKDGVVRWKSNKKGGTNMIDLIKVEEQPHSCRDIYQDVNTSKLYCRHINNRYSKGVYVNFWNTFNGAEPDCPLKDGTEIRIGNQMFVIERDEFTDWAIEREQPFRLKEYSINIGTYETIQIFRKTFNSIGEYKYMLDGEEINGYDRELNYDDPFTPIVKINCKNGYLITTNYKNQVEDIIAEFNVGYWFR